MRGRSTTARPASITPSRAPADDAYVDHEERWDPAKRPPHDEPRRARTFDTIDPFGNTLFVVGPARVERRSGGL